MAIRKRIRLFGFDYTSNRRHFVAICTPSPENTFGAIDQEGSLLLNRLENIALEQWSWLNQ